MIEFFFWIALALVVYTYIGYGVLVRFLLLFRQMFSAHEEEGIFHLKDADNLGNSSHLVCPVEDDLPPVTLLICAYNEQDVVHQKMENCRALTYPSEKLHILWVTDGTTDETNTLLSAYPEAEVMFQPERQGKTAALNRAVPQVRTPYVVFTDANTLLNPDAIQQLVRPFADERVGCVAGEKRIMRQVGDGLAAQGEGAYWRYESLLKRWDSQLCSTMGAAGELFAIRTALFRPIDCDMLLDDFIMSLDIVRRGYRIHYCPAAYACETGSANIREEEKRKKRIAAGGLQSIWVLRDMMNPFRYGLVAFQLVSHRFLRWSLTPLALFSLLPLNICLCLAKAGVVYDVLMSCQLLFYVMAMVRVKIPYYFLFMNINVFKGVHYLLVRRRGTATWEKAVRATPSNMP